MTAPEWLRPRWTSQRNWRAELTCWIVIPVKAPDQCKTRLRGALDDDAREGLVAAMLADVIRAARAVPGDVQIALLGPARPKLPDNVMVLADPGQGLNSAIASARDAALIAGATRIVFLSADLPHICTDEIKALIAVPTDSIAIAPDGAGIGTNALSLPLPRARDFTPAYGEASLTAHRAETARQGLKLILVERPGLAFDVDQPADLAGLQSRLVD